MRLQWRTIRMDIRRNSAHRRDQEKESAWSSRSGSSRCRCWVVRSCRHGGRSRRRPGCERRPSRWGRRQCWPCRTCRRSDLKEKKIAFFKRRRCWVNASFTWDLKSSSKCWIDSCVMCAGKLVRLMEWLNKNGATKRVNLDLPGCRKVEISALATKQDGARTAENPHLKNKPKFEKLIVSMLTL